MQAEKGTACSAKKFRAHTAPLAFFNDLSQTAALLLVRGADFLSVFEKPQREALAMLFLNLHDQGVIATEIFWGLWLFPLGLLVFRSGFLPRIWRQDGAAMGSAIAGAPVARQEPECRNRHAL